MSYVSAVAKLFETTGHADLLNATAYTTIAEWEKQDIPLDLVLATLEQTHTASPTEFSSFFQIAEIIEKDFTFWLCTALREEPSPQTSRGLGFSTSQRLEGGAPSADRCPPRY